MAFERLQSALARARAMREGPGFSVNPEEAPDAETVEDDVPFDSDIDRWDEFPVADLQHRFLLQSRVVTAGNGHDAPAFDMLRTKVFQAMRAHGWKRIAITSPDKSCGKSTVAMNLAFSLSRQKEIRTILAEVDLRRPSLAKALRLPPRAGMAAMLSREVRPVQAILRVRDNLAVVANRSRSLLSAELLHSPIATEVLREIEARYRPDFMVFDLPPVMEADDALAFLVNVDCALLVTSAEHTTTSQLEACLRDIKARTALAGVVLNKCRIDTGGY
jgi:protein-tyrosine kinase